MAQAVRSRLPPLTESGAEPVPPTEGAEATFQLPDGLPLADDQRLAVERCANMGLTQGLDSPFGKILVLTGGPGTGKTYTVRPIPLSRSLSIYIYIYICASALSPPCPWANTVR